MARPSTPGDVVAPLLAYLRERFRLSPEHEVLVRSMAVPIELARGEFLQHAGEVADQTCFVVTGLLRSYALDEDGHEHVLRFAPEGWWTMLSTGRPFACDAASGTVSRRGNVINRNGHHNWIAFMGFLLARSIEPGRRSAH